jgi:hypothetical protein
VQGSVSDRPQVGSVLGSREGLRNAGASESLIQLQHRKGGRDRYVPLSATLRVLPMDAAEDVGLRLASCLYCLRRRTTACVMAVVRA